MDLGERVATCEERLRNIEAHVSTLTDETRTNRHGLRSLDSAVKLMSELQVAEAKRVQRRANGIGLLLTGINVLVALVAVVAGVLH